jgi:predicted AlkP superfamily pyrophosphatase or phosphodiesterase
MKRTLLALLLVGCTLVAQGPAPRKPRLILAIAIDQFRYDYTLRFRADYTAGFKRLLEQGAVFDDAHYIHFPTVTAVGHSTFLSGATPSVSGIISNDWWDRELNKSVTSVSDDDTKIVGPVEGVGSSPKKLMVSTVGDEIRIQGHPSKLIGISIKDRSAILPAGHMADAAYWVDAKTNRWISSTWYMKELPAWVKQVNDANPAKRSENADWMPVGSRPSDKPFCSNAKKDGIPACRILEATPWGNEMIEELAEKAIANEQLGRHEGVDLLAVSFSSNDYVGHALGPDAPEVRDMAIRTDRLLGLLLTAAEQSAGAGNVLLVLTADHGVAPVPEVNTARRMPGGRLDGAAVNAAMQQALEKKYGAGKWVIGGAGAEMQYLNRELMAKYKVSEADAENTAAEAVRSVPHIARVYTGTQLRTGNAGLDLLGSAVVNGYNEKRSANIIMVPESYYQFGGGTGTTHGTPFNYDNHVPIIFFGAGIKPGHYYGKVAVNDIAPTLAAIAGVETPSGSMGRVLREMWQ